MGDVTIPAGGWLADTTDHPDDPAMTTSLLAGISPLAGWVYDAARTAREQDTDLRVHPAEFRRLSEALARVVRYGAWVPGDLLLGVPVTADPAVPEGMVRVEGGIRGRDV